MSPEALTPGAPSGARMRTEGCAFAQSGDTRCIVGTPTVATKYFGNAAQAARVIVIRVQADTDRARLAMYPRPIEAHRSTHAGSRHADSDPRICSQRDDIARRNGRRHSSSSAPARAGTPDAGHRDACTPSPHDTFRSMNERRRPTRRGRGHRPPNRPTLDSNTESSPYRDDSSLPAPTDTALPDHRPAPSSDGGDAGIPAAPPLQQPPYNPASQPRADRTRSPTRRTIASDPIVAASHATTTIAIISREASARTIAAIANRETAARTAIATTAIAT